MFERFLKRKPTPEQELAQFELQRRRRQIAEYVRETGALDLIMADTLIHIIEPELLDDLRALSQIDESDINRLTP